MKLLSLNCRSWYRDIKDNSRNWKLRANGMKNLIEDKKPDVICFQELLWPMKNYVPKGYKEAGIGVSHHIFYNPDRVNYINSGWTMRYAYATLEYRGCIFLVCSVHTRWERDILAKTCESINAKAQQYYNVLAAGDWNNNPLNISAMTYLNPTIPPEVDTFVSMEGKGKGCIDNLYYKDGGIYPASYEVIRDGYGCERISDHYAILYEL